MCFYYFDLFCLFLPTIIEFTEFSNNFIWLMPDTSLPFLFLVKSYSLYGSVGFLCKSPLKMDKLGKYTNIFLPCIYFVPLALPMLMQYYLIWFVVHHSQYVANMTYRITFHNLIPCGISSSFISDRYVKGQGILLTCPFISSTGTDVCGFDVRLKKRILSFIFAKHS